MPTYVYACDACQEQFEKFQSFQESPLKTCPKCQRETVRRVFQPVGIVFKGSGWYVTDSRSQNPASSTADTTPKETKEKPESSSVTKETKETKESSEPTPTPSSTTQTADSNNS